MLVEKEKPVTRADLLQGERRVFLSLSIDPIGDREFRGRLSCDALSHSWLAILIAAGVRRCFGLTTALAAPALLPWNRLVKL
jgi:hypothetical protein